MPRDFNKPAHFVDKGDPKLNGPFLDDVRADQERAYQEGRKKSSRVKKKAENVVELRPVAESDSNDSSTDE